MEKKNTLFLTILAVGTLLVAVVGATFAYFGSFTTTVTNRAAVNLTTAAAKSSSFVSTAAALSLSVAGSEMLKGTGSATQVGTYSGGNTNATLTVNLTANDTTTTTTCTYDVMYAYDSSSAKYGDATTPVTAGTANKEFTYTLTSSAPAALKIESTYATADSDFSVFKTATNETNAIKVASGTITAKNTTTTQTLSVNIKFYNFPTIDQSALASKSFAGKFYVNSSSVTCNTSAA